MAGIEFLHSEGIAHLDIKPENLLLDKNFSLRIADFDLAHEEDSSSSGKILSRGTTYYRAPEIFASQCLNGYKADIYSMGIVLFILKSGGKLPLMEDVPYKGVDLYDTLIKQPDEFWRLHASILNKRSDFFENDFRELFEAMTKASYTERAGLDFIKKSAWFNGPTYSNNDLAKIM